MNKKIYIASGLKNYLRVIELRDKLAEHGVWLTYDWAEKYKNHLEYIVETGVSVQENLEEIAQEEYQGVLDCHLLLFVCPAGRGSHFELGVAYTNNKPIIILQDNHYDPIAFYTLPGVKRYNDEEIALKRILELVTYNE